MKKKVISCHLAPWIQKDLRKQIENWHVREKCKISIYGSGRDAETIQGQQRNWQKKRDPAVDFWLQSAFKTLDQTWCYTDFNWLGLLITYISHPAMAWTFPLLIFKIERLHSSPFKDRKKLAIQRKGEKWIRRANKLSTCTNERTRQKTILPSANLKIFAHFHSLQCERAIECDQVLGWAFLF